MSQQNISATPKKTYAATLNAASPLGMQSTSICTRGMAKKAAVTAAAASLRTAHVPTRPRKISAASIAAAATAIIEAASLSRKENKNTKAEDTPPRKRRASPVKKIEEPTSPIIASVMTIGESSVEDQMKDMMKLLEQLAIENEEKNKKISELQKEMVELSKKATPSEPSEHSDSDKEDGGAPKKSGDTPPEKNVASFSEKQLQDLIANAIKSQLNGGSSSSSRYIKPYSRRIDGLKMPSGYQPPKFQQFDGKSNPKQHIAHFVETCNNAGTYNDLLVK